MLQAALAAWQCRRRGIPLVLDLYDNYESFGMRRVPGIKAWFRSACRYADGISTVSQALGSLVQSTYGPQKAIRVIVNGVDKNVFKPYVKEESRTRLGLPRQARLIGTAGSITGGRGIADMFEAFERLAREDENLWLVYAGPRDRAASRYQHPRIVDLGVLSSEVVPVLLSALDVAIICNRDSDFGRYCFPVKLSEIIACDVPLVAAAVGDVARVLAAFPDSLYSPGDPAQLAQKIERLLQSGARVHIPNVLSWQDCASQLEQFLLEILTLPHRRVSDRVYGATSAK
jgi:glycosyltransferase involved in cell wall biosynthesis